MDEKTEKRVPRMRTAANVVAEIKALDPKSNVSEYCVRQLIKQGALPVVWAGNKALINLDDVFELLRIGTKQVPESTPEAVGGIRRINVR